MQVVKIDIPNMETLDRLYKTHNLLLIPKDSRIHCVQQIKIRWIYNDIDMTYSCNNLKKIYNFKSFVSEYIGIGVSNLRLFNNGKEIKDDTQPMSTLNSDKLVVVISKSNK